MKHRTNKKTHARDNSSKQPFPELLNDSAGVRHIMVKIHNVIHVSSQGTTSVTALANFTCSQLTRQTTTRMTVSVFLCGEAHQQLRTRVQWECFFDVFSIPSQRRSGIFPSEHSAAQLLTCRSINGGCFSSRVAGLWRLMDLVSLRCFLGSNESLAGAAPGDATFLACPRGRSDWAPAVRK